MSGDAKHVFGGRWTEEKLDCLEKYLVAYLNVLKHQTFRRVYIDAFSGTGERYSRDNPAGPPAPGLLEMKEEQSGFFEGSVLRTTAASVAVTPHFGGLRIAMAAAVNWTSVAVTPHFGGLRISI